MIVLLVFTYSLLNIFTSIKCNSLRFLHNNHFTQVHSPQITRIVKWWMNLIVLSSKYLIVSYWLIGLLVSNDRFFMSFVSFCQPLTALYSQVSSKWCGNFYKFSEIFNNITPRIVIDIAIHFRYITVEQFSLLLV